MLFSDYETQLLGSEAYIQLVNELGDKAYDFDQIEDPVERKRAQDRVYEIFHNKVKEYMKNPKFKNIDGF